MKKLIIVLVVLTALYSCNSKNSEKDKTEVKISGKILNTTESFFVIRYQLESDTIKIDKKGFFETTISIENPCYVKLIIGNNNAITFLNPGTETSFEADGSDFDKSIVFNGYNADINNYLAQQKRIANKKILSDDGILDAENYDIFLTKYNLYLAEFEKNLKDISEKKDDSYESFKKAEAEKFKLIKHYILTEFMLQTFDKEIETPENAFKDLQTLEDDINLDNPDLLFFEEYWPFLSDILNNKTSKQIREDGITDCSMEEWGTFFFKEIDKMFTNEQTIDNVYYYFINQFISYYGPNSISDIITEYKNSSKCKYRVSVISNLIAEYEEIAPGKQSIEWSFPDINGKEISLSDFNGKYIYIDVWASWCGPCKEEIPYLETLKKKFIGKNITFISISVDEDIESWKSSLKTEAASGIQLYAAGWDNVLCKQFKINSIPRFILLDKQGKIINFDAERPSMNIDSILNELDGI